MTVPSSEAAPAARPPEPSDLAVAIRVGQKMLAAFGDPSGYDIYAYAQAHGGLAEALRILLRALGAEVFTDLRENLSELRCPAAHGDDPTPCDGPPVVTVLDAHNAGAQGCEHHGARLLASLDGGRVYALPDAHTDTAARVFKAAHRIRPFAWIEDAPRTQPSQLSRAENLQAGEDR